MIYVYSHLDYSEYPKEDKSKYCSISHKRISTPFENNIVVDDKEILGRQWGLSEVCGLEYLHKNRHLLTDDVIGYAHYRDWFENDELGDCDAVIPRPEKFNIEEQFKMNHNPDDYDELMSIIHEKYPTYEVNIDELLIRSMFITKREYFLDYLTFLFDIIDEFRKRHNLNTDLDIRHYAEENIDKCGVKDVEYQARMFGFISERLTTIFMYNYFRDKKFRIDDYTMVEKSNYRGIINKDSKIYVAGHRGLVGSAIYNRLKELGFNNIVCRTHDELDLTDSEAVKKFFDEEKPDVVILAAAFVGGIMANSVYRGDFIMKNLQIECNVINESYKHWVKKLLFLGSTCIYPKDTEMPIKEEYLLTGKMEYTNEPYAIAKIAGLKLCESYNLQYGTNYITVMPTNLYGPNDNFDLVNSHVLPAIMRKLYLSKLIHDGNIEAIRHDIEKRNIAYECNDKERGLCQCMLTGKEDEEKILQVLKSFGIEDNKTYLYGTGRPLREFLWSEDMADACIHILMNVDFQDIIGIEKYSKAQKGARLDGEIRNRVIFNRGGAIPELGEIKNTHINIGTGDDIPIRELALLIAKTVGFQGEIVFDSSKPDGVFRRVLDVSKLHNLGWHHTVNIEEGVAKLFDLYVNE